MLTIPEAAARLGVKRQWVWRLVKAGRIEAKLYGRDWLIEEREIERYEQERQPAHRPKGHRSGHDEQAQDDPMTTSPEE